jgi:hypothetical protein
MIVRENSHWKLTICEFKKKGVFGGIMYIMAIHS